VDINRHVYHLFLQDGWDLEMVVPRTLAFPSGIKKADPPGKEDPEIHYLALRGSNPRLYQFEGLSELLNNKRPGIIILDNDPVSLLTTTIGRWAKKNQAWVFCISNENLPLDIHSGLRRRGLRALPAILLKRFLLNRNRRLVDGVFTINREGEKIFVEEGFLNVRHMPLGFDPFFFHPDLDGRNAIRAKYNLNSPVVAYFGRLTPEKGVHILIQALKNLREMDWQLMMDSFDIYASAYNEEISRLLSESEILNRVVFIKPNYFEIATYMNAADVIVVPSISVANWKEQYGRVAAEAMACGKEVIASDSGALPELLDGHGFLFKEGDVDSLRDLLARRIAIHQMNGSFAQEVSEYAIANLSIKKQKAVMEAAFK
jgi:glycosyltransferase involved in cell wall biosynthesis